MTKTKLTISVQRDNIRWAKRYVKQHHTSIGSLVDEMIASLKAADEGGRLHPMLQKFKDGLFESGSPDIMMETFGKKSG